MSNETGELIEQLRKKIEDHYREAMYALEVLSRFAADFDLPAIHSATKARAKVETKPSSNGRRKSLRDVVIKAVQSHGGVSVDELEAETGLTKAQIRGVLYAPKLGNRFTKEITENGTALYFWTTE